MWMWDTADTPAEVRGVGYGASMVTMAMYVRCLSADGIRMRSFVL